jgi:demethylspheroidene O-methyltransferase
MPGFRQRWAERLHGWRNRIVADQGFQRWASRFPLTRPIARRRAAALFDVCAGFVYSQVLFACVRLRLVEILAEGPAELSVLARRLELPEAGAERLLRAAAALGLAVAHGPRRFGLGESGAALLGNPGIAAMVEHHALLYADLADPVALLRNGPGGTRLQEFWSYAARPDARAVAPDTARDYTRLMSSSQGFVAEDVLAAYRFDQHRHMLDVGGGDGTFLCRVAAAAPAIRLTLFDVPAVAAAAGQRFAAAGLAERARAIGGDFRTEALPQGADLVTLVRVLHDHDDDAVLAVLRAARAAIAPGGTLLVAEPMAGTPGAEAMGDAYFGLYLFAMGSGQPRTPARLAALLRQAGFTAPRQLPTDRPLIVGLIRANA